MLYVKTEEGLRQFYGNDPHVWGLQKVIWLDDKIQMVGYVSGANLTEEEILLLAEGAYFTGSDIFRGRLLPLKNFVDFWLRFLDFPVSYSEHKLNP